MIGPGGFMAAPKQQSGAHACPAGCGREQPAGMLMCLICWRAVPIPLRRDVNRAWREVQTLPRGVDAAEAHRLGMARVEEYRKARDAAIAAARERLIKKELKA
jgi:hypothetical protein